MTQKKKILIFSLVYLPEYVGGAEIAVDQITKQKELENYDFHMITLGAYGQPSKKVGSVTVHYTGLFAKTGFLFTISKFAFIVTSFFAYIRLQRKYSFDMMWALMANYAGLGAVCAKIMYPKIPFLLTIQEGDTIKHIMKRARLIWPLFRSMFVRANTIQVISHFLKDFSANILKQKDSEKIVVIPNGVDISVFSKELTETERQSIRNGLGYTADTTVVVTTSRLTHKNGVDTLIDTIQLLPETYHLLVIGAGPDENMLKQKVSMLGIETRVQFIGRKPYEDLYRYLKASDVFVRLSRSEGFGNSFIEAMATHIPVIGTDVGGIVDFLKTDVTGYLVKPENPQMAAEVIQKVGKIGKSSAVTTNAYNMVCNTYQWSHVAHQFDQLFKTIIKKHE